MSKERINLNELIRLLGDNEKGGIRKKAESNEKSKEKYAEGLLKSAQDSIYTDNKLLEKLRRKETKILPEGTKYSPIGNEWISLKWTKEQSDWWENGYSKMFEENKKIVDLSFVVELYLGENHEDFLRFPPNTSLFWCGCDFDGEIISEAVNNYWIWNVNEKILKESHENSRRDPKRADGEIVSRTIAKEMMLETLREMTLKADGGKIGRDGAQGSGLMFTILSGGMAEKASGTVFFANGNSDDRLGGFWKKTELPTLMKNKEVDMIVEIDAKRPEVVKSITFPNKLNVEKLSECKFPIPKSCLPDGCLDGTELKENGKEFVTCMELHAANIRMNGFHKE